jgi:SAM-dependent methyltransferase
LINNVSDAHFWNERYANNDIGWDLGGVTPVFKDWANNLKKKSKILVPGAGSGYDALYFANLGHEVLAVDFSEKAINRIKKQSQEMKINIQTLTCDFFNLTNLISVEFDYIVEYTFFCAIDPIRRKEYSNVAHSLLKESGLLVALFLPLNKDISEGGPPFSVSKSEIEDVFSKKFKLIKSLKHPLSIDARKQSEEYFEYKKILV